MRFFSLAVGAARLRREAEALQQVELQLGGELGHGGGEAVVPDVLTQTAQEEQQRRQQAAEAEATAAAASLLLQTQRDTNRTRLFLISGKHVRIEQMPAGRVRPDSSYCTIDCVSEELKQK